MPILDKNALTDIGCVRKINQDRMFAISGNINGLMCGLFAVADGMGGLADGDRAAATAVDVLEAWWHGKLNLFVGYNPIDPNSIFRELKTLFYDVNMRIKTASAGAMVGTTLSVILICDDQYYIAHSGDSRIYMLNFRRFQRISKSIDKLTEDHNLMTKQIKEGKLSIEEIKSNPKRNRLTSCLGVMPSPEIYFTSGLVKTNSMFILCSDGLYNVLRDEELLKKTSWFTACYKLTNNLIDMALKRKASDNVTVVAVKVKPK